MSDSSALTFLTLDASKILFDRNESSVFRHGGNYKIRFQYDLSDRETSETDIILSEDSFTDNALFFQLRKVLPIEIELRSSLVFVDFKEIFYDETSSFTDLTQNIPAKSELFADGALGYRIRLLFEDGLFLSFDGKNFQRFVPFDKSSSMARNCQITFIDSQFKCALEKRLMLDMDFTGMQLPLSKFYTYRGLYLSNGFRIDFGKILSLNEETVIVLPDYKASVIQNVFTALPINGGTLWDYKNTEKKLTLNLFDGEGLICPEFAQYISNVLRKTYNFIDESHSFQIRLPFSKGVLHEVDFEKFFSEQIGDFKNELLADDVFGITRDLRKAKIILTKSMFKCTDWIKDSGNFNPDPLKYFFAKFNRYDHALYVTNTEARLSNSGNIKLNYQFLSTLALTEENFNLLADDQINLIENFREKFADEMKNSAVNTSCLRAAIKNSAFLKDPKVKSIYEETLRQQECNLGLGRLTVEGEQRFLSCDLLSLLVKILFSVKNINLDDSAKNFLKSQCLHADRFFMPQNKLPFLPDKKYVLLRNPHLSRNEQVLLRAYVKRGNLYEKYFSQLKGAVMISAKSTVAMALGGADFDGDLVKITSDSRIVQAVKIGNIDNALSPVCIPSGAAKHLPLGYSIPSEVVINTFSSKVGMVSDLAVKLSQREYYSAPVEEIYNNACAKCTIVVGLEIDAAKTGNHPEENIKLLRELAKNCGENTFLKLKKILEQFLKWKNSPCVVSHGNTLFLYASQKAKETDISKLSIDPISAEKGAILERLVIRYLKFLLERKSPLPMSATENGKFFKFEVDGWRKKLDKNLSCDLKLLMKSYLHILSLDRKMRYMKNLMNQTKFKGHVTNILKLQYDDLHQKLSCGAEIVEALNQIYAELCGQFKNAAEVKKALSKMKTKRWHLTLAENRAKVAAEILGFDEAEKLPPVCELLFNFRCNGFMILYFVLAEIQHRLFDSSDFLTYDNSCNESLTFKKNPYFDELYRVYLKSIAAKKTKSIWNKKLIEICRKHLKEIFRSFGDKTFDEALKYFWAQRNEDSGRNFLWNVFTEQEIFASIYTNDAF